MASVGHNELKWLSYVTKDIKDLELKTDSNLPLWCAIRCTLQVFLFLFIYVLIFYFILFFFLFFILFFIFFLGGGGVIRIHKTTLLDDLMIDDVHHFTKFSCVLLSLNFIQNILWQQRGSMFIPPPNEVGGGVYWIHLVRPSVCPSVCRRHGFRSISQVCFGISIWNFICVLMFICVLP